MILRLWSTRDIIVFVPSGKVGKDFVLDYIKFMLTTLLYILLCLLHVACFRYSYFRSLMPKVNPRIVYVVWNVILIVAP